MIARLSSRCAMLSSRCAMLPSRCALALFIALASIGIAVPAQAQAPAPMSGSGPIQHPTPAAILIAKQIVEIKGVKAMFDPVVRGVVEKAKNVFMQTNFMLAKDLNDIAAMMHKDYDSRVNELVDMTARVYATHFTEQELKDMLTFYQSPLGKKMIVEEPKALDESMTNTATWADNLSEDVMARMRAEMKKRGHEM
jgi:hypothetical protein